MTKKLLGTLEPKEFDDLEDELQQLSEAALIEMARSLEAERIKLGAERTELEVEQIKLAAQLTEQEAELQSLQQELLGLLEEQERHPDLEVIKAVLDRGQAIIPALVAILEDDDYYGGAEAVRNIWTPVHAANILCELRAVEALPALRRAMTRPDEHGMAEWISEDLVKFGPVALDTAEAILQDKTVAWYPRAMAAETLKAIAQHHPETYERVTATMRAILPDPAIDLPGYESYEQVKAELDDPHIWDSLVSDLCDLQDPQAYDLLAIMFDRRLIWDEWIGREDFERAYARPPGTPRLNPEKDLLTRYRERQPQERPQRTPQAHSQPMRVKKIGRNAPCPCGSGKKYKHCHGRRGAPALPA